jgi:hypothetical protein
MVLENLTALMHGNFGVIRCDVNITRVLPETADASELARSTTDLNAVRNAGMQTLGVVTFQLPGGLCKVFVRAGAHRINQMLILIHRNIRLDLANSFFVLQQSDELDGTLPHLLKFEQILELIHLEKCSHDIRERSMFRSGASSKFTIQPCGTGEMTGLYEGSRLLLQLFQLPIDIRIRRVIHQFTSSESVSPPAQRN